MTKAEKAWLKKTLTIIDKRQRAHDGSMKILRNQVEQLSIDVKNLLLTVQETQAQQRRTSGPPRVGSRESKAPPTVPRRPIPRPSPR